MKSKISVCGLYLMFLVGCNDSNNERTGIASQAVKQSSKQVETTALYLRSGVGLDFGRKPIADRVSVQESGKYRQVTFLFDESPEAIDKSIREILEVAGYKRELTKQEKFKLHVYYRKVGFEKTDLANTMYTLTTVNGEVKTHLLFSFSID